MFNRSRKVNFSDIVGRRVGKLTVVSFIEHKQVISLRTGNTRWEAFYRVRCDCGTVKTTTRKVILAKQTRSCGCAHKDITYVIRLAPKGQSEFNLTYSEAQWVLEFLPELRIFAENPTDEWIKNNVISLNGRMVMFLGGRVPIPKRMAKTILRRLPMIRKFVSPLSLSDAGN